MIERLAPFDRIPPQALEAEQAVLGSMLIERTAVEIAAGILKPSDFYRDAHRVIYEAILRLFDRDEPIDLLSVKDVLTVQDVLENIGGGTYLIQLTNAVGSAANVEHYAKIVRDKAVLRGLIDAANQIHGLAYGEYEDIGKVVALAGKALETAAQRAESRRSRSIREIVSEVFGEIEYASEHPNELDGVPTGLYDLDRGTNGWQPGELILIGARPGVGKTAIAANTFASAALAAKSRVVIFSLEMADKQIVRRMVGASNRVSLTHMRRGTLLDEDWRRIGEACSDLSEQPLVIDDNSDTTPTQIRLKLRQVERKEGKVGLVIVDYLALVEAEIKFDGWREVDANARAMKKIAKEFNCPVILLTQLNKEIDARGDGRPLLKDIKDAGEAHADIVIFLWPAKNQIEGSEVRKIWLTVAKNRNGQAHRDVPLAYHEAWTRFDQMADDGSAAVTEPPTKLLPRKETQSVHAVASVTRSSTQPTNRSPYADNDGDSFTGTQSALEAAGWNP